MTRWLDETEQATWRAFLAATSLLARSVDQQLQNDSGIPIHHYRLLVELSEAPGRTLRMSELAASSQASRSRITHAVGRLVERGWVTRSGCPEDGRGLQATLTEAGFQALANAAAGHVEHVRSTVFDRLRREQVEQLRAICEAILVGITGSPNPVPPGWSEGGDGPCSDQP